MIMRRGDHLKQQRGLADGGRAAENCERRWDLEDA